MKKYYALFLSISVTLILGLAHGAPKESPLSKVEGDILFKDNVYTDFNISSSSVTNSEDLDSPLSHNKDSNTIMNIEPTSDSDEGTIASDVKQKDNYDNQNTGFAQKRAVDIFSNKRSLAVSPLMSSSVSILSQEQENKLNEEKKIEIEGKEEKTVDEKLAKGLEQYSPVLKGYIDSEDKGQFIKQLSIGAVENKVNNTLSELLHGYQGVNSDINLRYDTNGKVRISGKLLVPFHNSPKHSLFTQSGITESYNDRKIWHFGIGHRYYPYAESLEQVGDLMLGYNAFYDQDLSRGHKRYSLGFEVMTDQISLSSNIYRRLSGWKDSVDFESSYVQERPSNGFDLRTKIFVPYTNSKLSITADAEKWLGDKVAPFGSVDKNKLVRNPWVFSGGFELKPVPAITIAAKTEHTDVGEHNQEVSVNFNIPLSYEIKDAFNWDKSNNVGNDVASSRSMLVNRDYDMVLEYRATPGRYKISYCGKVSTDKHCILIKDYFDKPATGEGAIVTSPDKCVIFSEDGNYVVDENGHIFPEIIDSCVPNTDMSVEVGNSQAVFPIEIERLNYKIEAVPVDIERFQSSLVTLLSSPLSEGLKVDWKVKGHGRIENQENAISAAGKATAVYFPDKSIVQTTPADIVAVVANKEYPVTVNTYVFGTQKGDLYADKSILDGGETTKIYFKNLRPNSLVFWYLNGPATYVKTPDDNPAHGEAAPLHKPNLNNPPSESSAPDVNGEIFEPSKGDLYITRANENGVATIKVKVDEYSQDYPLGDKNIEKYSKQNVTVHVNTEDPESADNTPFQRLNDLNYFASFEVPTLVGYGDPFEVKLKGLKPGTEVFFDTDPKGSVSDLNGAILIKLFSDPYATADQNGVARATYLTTMDYADQTGQAPNPGISKVTGIRAFYYRHLNDTQHMIKADPFTVNADGIDIEQHILTWDFTEIDMDDIEYFSGYDELRLKVVGGKFNHEVQFEINNVDIVHADDVFNADGEAYITIKGKGQNTGVIDVVAKGMGNKIDFGKALEEHTNGNITDLEYHYWNPKIDNLNATHIHNYQMGANTFDVKTEQKFMLSGGKPKTNVNWEIVNSDVPGGVTLQTQTTKVDRRGVASVQINPVNVFEGTNIQLKASFSKSSKDLGDETKQFNLYKYSLLTQANKKHIEPFTIRDGQVVPDTVTVTVKGGRVGEPVSFNTSEIEQNAKIINKDDVFNGQGQAVIELESIKAYKQDISVKATGVGTKSKDLVIPYKIKTYDAVALLPKCTYEKGRCVEKSTRVTNNGVIDYETEYTFKITKLMPLSEITVTMPKGVTLKDGNTYTVPVSGEVELTINAINDFKIGDANFSIDYFKSTADLGNNTISKKSYNLNIYDYTLTMTGVPDFIIGDDTFTANVSGGRANTKVTWSISGNGKITTKSSTFDGNGNAKATIQGIAPFTSTINLGLINIVSSIKDVIYIAAKYELILMQNNMTCSSVHNCPTIDNSKGNAVKLKAPPTSDYTITAAIRDKYRDDGGWNANYSGYFVANVNGTDVAPTAWTSFNTRGPKIGFYIRENGKDRFVCEVGAHDGGQCSFSSKIPSNQTDGVTFVIKN